MDIKRLVADFSERLNALVDEISLARARQAVMHALGDKRGRLPRGLAAIIGRKPRRKGPRQLCPVPGCTNPAAPVFGMVCAEHKGVGKRKIKQYREERRSAKLSAKAASGPRAGRGPARGSKRAVATPAVGLEKGRHPKASAGPTSATRKARPSKAPASPSAGVKKTALRAPPSRPAFLSSSEAPGAPPA